MKHLTFLALAASAALAGPLDPPVGPIVPTQKPLAEIEPRIAVNATNTPGDADSLFRISQPGSYYLTGNITGVANRHGIEINASGVTIDLQGFELVGTVGSLSGIATTTSNRRDINLRNGTIRNWGASGIDLATTTVVNGRIEHITARENASSGIQCGPNFVVTHCTITNNGGNGLFTAEGAVISHCVARTNSLVGIFAGFGSSISHSSAVSNGSFGIRSESGCVISQCSALSNTGSGILAGNHSLVSNCSASSNTGDGITANFGASVLHSVSSNNTISGVVGLGGNTIASCNTVANLAYGISAGNDSVIQNNTCDSNGSSTIGAGILVNGTDTRVEGNNCTDNIPRGIDIANSGNLIIRNSCSGSPTNYVIAANNRYGPITDLTLGSTAPVSGNTGGDTVVSTHPWANFAY